MGTLGGLIGGASYGYGSQVASNLSRGMCFWDALTTNIDAGQVALCAGLGTVMGLGIGAAAASVQALLGYLGLGKTVYDGLNADGDPTNEIRTGTITVYRLVENGVTKYIGITNDFFRRAGEHLTQKGWTVRPIQGLENLSRTDARAVEQVLIEQFGLTNLYNQINSIANSNPIYIESIRRGIEILSKVGYFGE